jgi:hypothetical protein
MPKRTPGEHNFHFLLYAASFDAGKGAFVEGVFAAVAEAIGVALAVSPDGEVQSVLFDSGGLDENVIVSRSGGRSSVGSRRIRAARSSMMASCAAIAGKTNARDVLLPTYWVTTRTSLPDQAAEATPR